MAPVRVRRPEKLGPNALKLYKSNYNNLVEVHKTKLANINIRNEIMRNWERVNRQNLHDKYESIHPRNPSLATLGALIGMQRHKHSIKEALETGGVFRDPTKGILAY